MSRTIETDICISGAGPGGVTTALFLAKRGLRSVLVDKAQFPRDKVCGDALSGKVVEVLKKLDPSILQRLNVEPFQLGSWGVNFIAPNFKTLKVPFRKEKINGSPPGYISRRTNFDDFLLNEARQHSEIEILENTELADFEKTTDGYNCHSAKKDVIIKTKLLIAADGAQSKFARHHAGISLEKKHYCAGIRAYYKGVHDLDRENFIELYFLKELLPGYFWIFPLPDGGANVGLGIRSDKVQSKNINLKKMLPEIINSYPVIKERFKNASRQGEISGFGLPLGSKKRKLSGESFMLVGDAASLIDPFTGEGIGNAMMSGMLAAQKAEECLKLNVLSEKLLSGYDEQVYKRLWSELSLSSNMQRLASVPWLFNLVVSKASSNPALQEMISGMFEDIDLRKKLKQPSFYVNLLLGKKYSVNSNQ